MVELNSASKDGPRIAAVGCGYWGKNIVRNVAKLGYLAAVSDQNTGLAEEFGRQYSVPARNLDALFADNSLDAIAFATPASLHASHVRAAIASGKDVFVEKPLALTVREGRSLVDLAKKERRILMVGHLLQYHPIVIRLLELVHGGRLGKVEHIHSSRLNLGKIRTEEDVLWSFAPHDISVILSLIGDLPESVQLLSNAIVNQPVADISYLHMRFGGGALATAFSSWLHPFKEQKLVVVGSEAHAVFDDTLAWRDKLSIYDHKVSFDDGVPRVSKAEPDKVVVVQTEPLAEEILHFADCIKTRRRPRTDGVEALGVLSVLDAATRSGQVGKPAAPVSVVGV